VHEYFLFDPLNERLKPPLTGYRMVGGRYAPVSLAGDGSLSSDELGLRFVPAGATLELIENLHVG
jgi:hypothetical protein